MEGAAPTEADALLDERIVDYELDSPNVENLAEFLRFIHDYLFHADQIMRLQMLNARLLSWIKNPGIACRVSAIIIE